MSSESEHIKEVITAAFLFLYDYQDDDKLIAEFEIFFLNLNKIIVNNFKTSEEIPLITSRIAELYFEINEKLASVHH